jgi:hypothetical protein
LNTVGVAIPANVIIVGVNTFSAFDLGNGDNLPVELHFCPALRAFLFVAFSERLTMTGSRFHSGTRTERGYPQPRCTVQHIKIFWRGITGAD